VSCNGDNEKGRQFSTVQLWRMQAEVDAALEGDDEKDQQFFTVQLWGTRVEVCEHKASRRRREGATVLHSSTAGNMGGGR